MGAAEQAVQVVQEPDRVAAVLPPLRRRLLQELAEPESAAGLARRLGLPRQKVNYHLRELERQGFLSLVHERQRRGCVERCLRATAKAFVVNPNLLGPLAGDPDTPRDRFSSAYLVARAAKLVEDVALLRERAEEAERPLITLTLETEIAFASAKDFRRFCEDLSDAAESLARNYHRADSSRSRRYRLVAAVHPSASSPAARAQREDAP